MAATSDHFPVVATSPAIVWQQYRRTDDMRLRDRLVFTLAPLIKHAGAATPEQAQRGVSALLVAIETYSPVADGALEAFAWAEVRAALSL